ncbi:c-type cytochrome [Lysobacter sp. A3-1-A15]
MNRKTVLVLALLAGAALAAMAGLVWSGFYNVAADDPHSAPVYSLLATMRDRSIQARAGELEIPADLMDRARIVQGSGNYDAMCMECHLAPGMDGTELSRGLYPSPPDLTRSAVDAAEAFWVIKHGIKASGMPAWGQSMDDAYVWNMAAFLQVLPGLDPAQYQAMVDSSGGHEHGGGETQPHAHAPGVSADHHDAAPARSEEGRPEAAQDSPVHDHPPGTPANHHDAPSAKADARLRQPGNDGPAHAHPPGTPADHHATAPGAKPIAQPEAPPPQPESHAGHDHDH